MLAILLKPGAGLLLVVGERLAAFYCWLIIIVLAFSKGWQT
jgi:hypothetical protein